MKEFVPGLKIGHYTDIRALTGCTVIIARDGAVGGVDVRGGAPGTRETDLLRPVHLVNKVHAVVLSGGSAFGLSAATGVMKYLEEQDIGFDVEVTRVPIVPSAVLFDLMVGDPNTRPGEEEGYKACEAATSEWPEEGNVGAGTGATVGKGFGMSGVTKSGFGAYKIEIGDLVVAAVVAVNAFGDIIDPHTGEIVAGTRDDEGRFVNTRNLLKQMGAKGFSDKDETSAMKNTTIGLIATNAILTKNEVNKIAQMGHDGLARTIVPVHTMFDGDTIFALATGKIKTDLDVTTIGALGVEAMEEAVLRAVKHALSVAGIPRFDL